MLNFSQSTYQFFIDSFLESKNTFTAAIKTQLINGNLVNTVTVTNIFQIKRVIVTPTREISLREELVPSSRFLLEIEKQIKDVITVLFRDPDIIKGQDNSFVQSEMLEEVLELRKQIVPYPENFPSVAKYLSRLGMYNTATTFVFNFSTNSIIYSNDNRAENRDLTTDGAGLISLSKAKEISEKLELDETPSVFQIRYSGFKDVVSCAHDNGHQ